MTRANARVVSDITTKNGLGANFGPFSNDGPVIKADGSTEILTKKRIEKLRDRGLVVQNKVGLE